MNRLWSEVVCRGYNIKDKRTWYDLITQHEELRFALRNASDALAEQIRRDRCYKAYDSLGMLLDTKAFDEWDKSIIEDLAKWYLQNTEDMKEDDEV
jgi:hypothetical protein